MRWLVLNGSPRGQKSNTRMLLGRLLAGLGRTPGHEVEVAYLNLASTRAGLADRVAAADRVILAFPLYADAMPSIVMASIEALAPLVGRPGNPPLGFIVQSGFPEACHSRPVQAYLEKLARRLGCRCLGTVVKGGIEGIQVMPGWMTRGTLGRFEALGERLGRDDWFDPALTTKLAGAERLSALGRFLVALLGRLGLMDSYWNQALRRNRAFERRLDRPYVPNEF
jgi:NAD(P)H-dependent FMN reductase